MLQSHAIHAIAAIREGATLQVYLSYLRSACLVYHLQNFLESLHASTAGLQIQHNLTIFG